MLGPWSSTLAYFCFNNEGEKCFNPDTRTTLKDIWDIRQSKLRLKLLNNFLQGTLAEWAGSVQLTYSLRSLVL
jgi:hypothetical protein